MALLFADSFDHYETVDLSRKYSTIGASQSIAANGRCSTNALVVDVDPTFNGVVKGCAPTANTQAIWGFAVKFTEAATQGNFCSVMSGASNVMSFRRTSTGSIEYSINDAAAFSTWTSCTGGDVIRVGQWYFIEFKIVLATTAAGSIQIRVNSGDVTSSGFSSGVTTASYASTWDGVKLGGAGFGGIIYYDDFYMSDTSGASPWNGLLGDIRVEYLQPTSNGIVQEWDNTGGAAAWNSVDDGSAPDDDTTYISTAVANEIATFNYENSSLPTGATVFGVQVSFLAKKDEPGDRAIAPVVREASVNYLGSNTYISDESYDYRHVMMQTNPADAAAWAIADVNTNEIGVKVVI